jgi:hypothetical protein
VGAPARMPRGAATAPATGVRAHVSLCNRVLILFDWLTAQDRSHPDWLKAQDRSRT